MPSRVFTRAQVLAALADDVARREATSIPDFIYLFLRDVFFAVDDDSDGYVTAAAVSRVFPSLVDAHTPPTPASCSSTATSVSSSAAPTSSAAQGGREGGGMGRAVTALQPLMAPAVHPPWWSATSFVAPTHGPLPTAAQRPLDLCAFMQSYWPVVSDRMAHLVGDDTWSQRSSSSDDPECAACRSPSVPARQVRRTLFSPSPFRDVTDDAAADGVSDVDARDGGCESAFSLCDDVVDAEQQRLYREAVRHLWSCGGGASAAAGIPQAPQRVLSDAQLSELHAAFCFLDTNNSGYISAAELVTALDALLRTAASADLCDGDGRGAEEAVPSRHTAANAMTGVPELAASMMRAAVSASSPSSSSLPPTHAHAPSFSLPSPSGEPCLRWTAFVRTLQCDVGAFPAELIAWCAGCARAAEPPLSYTPPPHMLATSPQWMSPVECAVLQELLVSYSDVLRNDTSSLPTSTSAAGPALSERSSVNTHTTKKPSCPRLSVEEIEGVPPPQPQVLRSCNTGLTHTTTMTLRRWCHDGPTRHASAATTAKSTAMPIALLASCLRRDLEELLFRGAAAFSAAAVASLRSVADHHAQAVCTVARRAALVPDPVARHPAPCDALLVDVERLVNIIADDPRHLRLDVLLLLEARLAAVVDAAQHLPRRRVEECVVLLAALAHVARRDGAAGLAEVLELRDALSTVSPLLARLVTGAAGIAGGRLHLEDCLAALSYQVLAVPPAMPRDGVETLCGHPCYVLLHDAHVQKASQGWLRYACRRLAASEVRVIVAALQAQPCVTAALHDATPCPPHERFAALWPAVRACCGVCRIDAVVAAHVALAVVATALLCDRVQAGGAATATTSRWTELEGSLIQWAREQHNATCTADSADAWSMYAITCVAGELGPVCGRAVSVALCSMRLTQPVTSRAAVVVVEEALLTETLTHVVAARSLWAYSSMSTPTSTTAADAQARLVHTIVGACPRRESPTLLDATALLRRWLEAHPLPLPVTHLSVCCSVAEVESTYYTLKRLAASEEGQRRRSETPARCVTAGLASRAASCAASPAVTGVSAVCLSELLENDDVLLALYAVSAPAHVGVWGGALSHLSAVLRPVLLSPTGVRVSVEKWSAQSTCSLSPFAAPPQLLRGETGLDVRCSDSSTSALESALVSMAVPAALQHAVAQLLLRVDQESVGAVTEEQLRSHRSRVPTSARYGWHRFVTALCSRSLPASCPAPSAPPPPQLTKAASGSATATSTSTTAATATAINTSAAHASVAFVTGGFLPSVLRSHRWRRRQQQRADDGAAGCRPSAASRPVGSAKDETSRSSLATQRSEDEVATVFTLGDLLARVAELRACVQAQLLGEAHEAAEKGKVAGLVVARRPAGVPPLVSATSSAAAHVAGVRKGPVPPSLTALVRDAGKATSSPAAGTAQWWAKYLEEFCRSFSSLAT